MFGNTNYFYKKSITSLQRQNKKARAMETENGKTDKINSLKDLIPFLSEQDNTKNTVYFADVPEICLKEPCMLGVDEAGRGPVLGPMVYGIAFCPIEKAEMLKNLGCADSKQLSEENREHIFNEITTQKVPKTNLGWAVEVISPNYISNCMYRRTKHSLNEVSMNSAIGLIQRALDLNANVAEIYVDTVGPPEKYQAKLEAIFPKIKITVAKKADSTYSIVSAASICAKVTRDHALKAWQFPEGLDLTHENFGSGYPGDPVTKSFLQENIDPVFGFPRLVRFSWSTAETILNSKAFPMQFNEDEEVQIAPTSKAVQITSFFNKYSKTGVKQRDRHVYFKNRFLDNVSDL